MMSCNKNSSDSISPGPNRSLPFSISAILSDEVGQKKSPPATCSGTPFSVESIKGSACTSNHYASETPKRPRKSSHSFSSSRTPKMSHSDTGKAQPNYQVVGGTKPREGFRGAQHTATYFTPNKHPSCQMNSNHVSPFNPNLLVALGHHPSPSREEQDELFSETSLDMLSSVAHYHGELSGMDANSTTDSTMREKFSNIKLMSSTEDNDTSVNDSRGVSLGIRSRKTATPSILKRDKRRRRISSGGSACQNSSGDEDTSSSFRYSQTNLNAGFLSPLSTEKLSTNKELGFSPSIFLSRPENSHLDSMPQFSSDPPTSSVPIPIPKPDSSSGHDYREPSSRHAQCSSSRPWSSSPGYESDCPRGETSDSGSGNRDDFVTSTPIKPDKENQQRGNSSAATEEEEGAVWPLTSQYSTGRKHLREREANDYSSGSDTEAIKKPRLPTPTQKPPQLQPQSSHKKSKARTKLSPLLENSYSPIFKDGHLPSPLTTALATTPTRGLSYGIISQAPASILPQVPAQASITPLPSSLPAVSQPPRPFLAPPTSRPTTLFGANAMARGPPPGGPLLGTQALLGVSSPNPTLQYHPFQAVPGLINPAAKDRLQLSAHQHTSAHPMLNSLSLAQLRPSSLAFSSLATAGVSQGVRAYNSSGIFTPANIAPGYMPLVMTTPTQPLPAPSCMYAPYTSNPQLVNLDKSTEERKLGGSAMDKKTLQSVPPWFIFSDNRSEKRSRLTEAINKSLSETPSQTSKLPEEWTKLACGQTKDQKMLTEKARMFLHFRPRQLTFSNDTD